MWKYSHNLHAISEFVSKFGVDSIVGVLSKIPWRLHGTHLLIHATIQQKWPLHYTTHLTGFSPVCVLMWTSRQSLYM